MQHGFVRTAWDPVSPSEDRHLDGALLNTSHNLIIPLLKWNQHISIPKSKMHEDPWYSCRTTIKQHSQHDSSKIHFVENTKIRGLKTITSSASLFTLHHIQLCANGIKPKKIYNYFIELLSLYNSHHTCRMHYTVKNFNQIWLQNGLKQSRSRKRNAA